MAVIIPFPLRRGGGHALPDSALEELVLELFAATMHERDGKRRAVAEARLVYYPATPGAQPVASTRTWQLQAPLGPIEAEDLRWYLEKYAIWPGSAFATRKAEIEGKLQHWGALLFEHAMQKPVLFQSEARELASEATAAVLAAWRAGSGLQRCFSISVDATPQAGASAEQVQQVREAAGALLALPWELLHDGTQFLIQDDSRIIMRRRLLGVQTQVETKIGTGTDSGATALQFTLPIRILLVSPRPDVDIGYIDHRISARPLVDAAQALPGQVEIHILQTPSFAGLQAELERAQAANQAYHVLHFDGHGVFDANTGQGALCFEHPHDSEQWQNRRYQLVHATQLGNLLQQYRIPLVFLEACQSAMANSATESVATALLQAGVGSVVAMSYSVLVATASRFVRQFYQSLTQGARVGEAMLAAQRYLATDTVRGRVFGEGEFHLQDWFVPVLYQERADPPLFQVQMTAHALSLAQTNEDMRPAPSLGDIPAEPENSFIGRSRELLELQRRLLGPKPHLRFCVILGQGGEGKTTLAAECARWLVRSQQIARAAFVSVELRHHVAAVLDALGRQLVGAQYSVAQYNNLDEQCAPLEAALREQATLLVLDNMESILPPPWLPMSPILLEHAHEELAEILHLVQRLMVIGDTRVIFTSREALPGRFGVEAACLPLAHLDLHDAVALIESALGGGSKGTGEAERARLEQIEDLAQAVHCHARTLALLGPNLRERGVVNTRGELVALMGKMERYFPGEREKSLFASVELSLARLSPENRERVRVLGVFHGGVQLGVLRAMTDWPEDDVVNLSQCLLQIGLAKLNPYQHLTLQPALCPWLAKKLSAEENEGWAARWRAEMLDSVEILYRQLNQNSELAATLTLLELANLFALLAQVESAGNAVEKIALATRLYHLLRFLGKPQLKQRVGQVRDAAQAQLGAGWQYAHFEAARTQIEQQRDAGQMQAALAGARALLQQALTAGAQAYSVADYDCALAHNLLGEMLFLAGHSQAALPLFQQAEQAFTAVALCRTENSPNKAAAERMASTCLMEQAACLCALGQYDAAATACQTAIAQQEVRGAVRSVAVGKLELARVYYLQKRYQQAFAEYEAARSFFTELNEQATVAVVWHQIGIAHEHAGNPGQAEDAFRQSLAIEVRLGNVAGQADTLMELGVLYKDLLQRPEQAMVFYQQALDSYVELGDKAKEGVLHSNLAITLLQLGNLPSARAHIRQAIACKAPFGHTVEPWKSWAILCDIESAAGNSAAAQQARQEALKLYLAYRRDGGESHSRQGRLCAAIHTLLHTGDTSQAQTRLQILASDHKHADNAPWQALLAALLALSQGNRDPALALDERLHYQDAAEITLLLETLPPAAPAN